MARVVIIGAGIAGLSAAIHAVSEGHHVVVLEKKSKNLALIVTGEALIQVEQN